MLFHISVFNTRCFKPLIRLAQVSNGGDDVSHCLLTGDWRSGQRGADCTKSNPHPQHCLPWNHYLGL